MPLEFSSNLMASLWGSVAPRLKRHRRALAHLESAFPEKTEAERERIAREMWGHLGRTFAEFFHLDESSKRVAFESTEKLKIVQEGGPYVVCAMHMGNWELMARRLGRGRPAAGRRLSAADQPARRRRAAAPARAALSAGAAFAVAGDAAQADEDRQGRRLARLSRRPSRRQRYRRAVLRPSRPFQFGAGAHRPPIRPEALRRADYPQARCAVLRCASSRWRCRSPPIATPISSPPPPICRRNTRRSSARRPSNGCGRIGAGIEKQASLRLGGFSLRRARAIRRVLTEFDHVGDSFRTPRTGRRCRDAVAG